MFHMVRALLCRFSCLDWDRIPFSDEFYVVWGSGCGHDEVVAVTRGVWRV